MSVTFNGIEKKIHIDVGVTELDIGTVYSEWKRWCRTNDNLKYLPAMRNVGGDPIIGGKFLGSTYFMINGWTIAVANWNHIIIINGNLYSEDGSSPVVNYTASTVTIIQTVSNLVDSQVIESDVSINLKYDGVIYIDMINGTPGTEYPVGTIARPSNNLSDAIIICTKVGTKRLCISGDITIDVNLTGYQVKGFSGNNLVTLINGVDITNTKFEQVTLYGHAGGHFFKAHDCSIDTLEVVSATFTSSTMLNRISVADGAIITMHLCYSRVAGLDTPIIDLSHCSSCNLNIRAYSGGLKITNSHSINNIGTIEYIAGNFKLDDSNTNGSFVVRGTTSVSENHNNIANIDGALNNDSIWSYDISKIHNTHPTIGSFIKNKLITTAKMIGLLN